MLKAVNEGLLCARAADAVLEAAGQAPSPRDPSNEPAADLSPRELQVLRLLVRDQSNKETARALTISPRTVPHHTLHIYAKTGMRSRGGAALWAVDRGLLS